MQGTMGFKIAHGSQPGMVADVWGEEAQRLAQLLRPLGGFVEHTKRVSPTCLIHLARNRYSVPASYRQSPGERAGVLRARRRRRRGADRVRARPCLRPLA